MRRLKAQRRSLERNPPPEFFLASYFIGRDWWHPPSANPAGSGTALPESDLPEFEA